MASEEERGARPKERPRRVRPSVDYKMLHEGAGLGEATPGRISETVSVSSPSQPKDIPDDDLGHEDAARSLLNLDREIEALETSIREVNSQLKAASLRKEHKLRTERLTRLKRELFVVEQQLQKSEEEGELNKKDTTKLTNTKPQKLMTCTVKQTHKPASKDRSVDSKGVRFKQTDQVTSSDLSLSALGLQSETESEHDSENESDNDYAEIDPHCDHDISKTSKKSKKSPHCITHHQILCNFHKYGHILHCSLNMCLSQFPLCL